MIKSFIDGWDHLNVDAIPSPRSLMIILLSISEDHRFGALSIFPNGEVMDCLKIGGRITSNAKKWVVDEDGGRFGGIRSKTLGINLIMVNNSFPRWNIRDFGQSNP